MCKGNKSKDFLFFSDSDIVGILDSYAKQLLLIPWLLFYDPTLTLSMVYKSPVKGLALPKVNLITIIIAALGLLINDRRKKI